MAMQWRTLIEPLWKLWPLFESFIEENLLSTFVSLIEKKSLSGVNPKNETTS